MKDHFKKAEEYKRSKVCGNYNNGFYANYDSDLCINCGHRKALHKIKHNEKVN